MSKFVIIAKRKFPLGETDVKEGAKIGALETDVDPGILADLIRNHFVSVQPADDEAPEA